MAQHEAKPQKRMPGTWPQLPRNVLLWWLMSLAVVIWYAAGLWPRSQPEARIPYSLRVIAYHECGHAVVAWLTPAADPVRKVTIVPHGQALGMTEQLPGEDRHNLSLSYLKARLAMMLGGRTAEEIVFDEVTTGAENDLVEATRLARRMVTRWGMSKLGLVAFKTDEQQPFLGYEISQGRDYSEATAARIDQEVLRLLQETHDGVRRCLTESRERLDRLVDALPREETVSSDELHRILGPRPASGLEQLEKIAAARENNSRNIQSQLCKVPSHA